LEPPHTDKSVPKRSGSDASNVELAQERALRDLAQRHKRLGAPQQEPSRGSLRSRECQQESPFRCGNPIVVDSIGRGVAGLIALHQSGERSRIFSPHPRGDVTLVRAVVAVARYYIVEAQPSCCRGLQVADDLELLGSAAAAG
jgi:hypothetical protein